MDKKSFNNIDSGLDKLCADQIIGETASIQKIADACQCSNTYIVDLQNSALKKIRKSMADNPSHPFHHFFEN